MPWRTPGPKGGEGADGGLAIGARRGLGLGLLAHERADAGRVARLSGLDRNDVEQLLQQQLNTFFPRS